LYGLDIQAFRVGKDGQSSTVRKKLMVGAPKVTITLWPKGATRWV